MAKFPDTHITGTFGDITIYKMFGKKYGRKKSSLTRKRVLKSKVFEKTMKHANDMGCAARIGSVIYRALPADIRERWLYRAITGEAASLLYSGKTEQEVESFLWEKYIEETNCKAAESPQLGCTNFAHSTPQANKQLREVFEERWEKQGKPGSWFKDAWQRRGHFNRERFREVLKILEAPWEK